MVTLAWTDLASTGAAIVTAVGVVIAVWTLRSDHNRSRLERSIDLMKYYIDTYSSVGGAKWVHVFAESLDNDQLQALNSSKGFSITAKQATSITPFLNETECEALSSGEDFAVSANLSNRINVSITTLLNCLELISAAYFAHIVDRDTIKTEFHDIIRFENNQKFASKLRDLKAAYPSLSMLEADLTKAPKDRRRLP